MKKAEMKQVQKKICSLFFILMITLTGINVAVVYKVEAEELGSYNLKLMTFNIRNNASGTGEIAWANRKHRVANAIKSYTPDIVGIQEAYKDQIDYLQANLNASYASIGVSRNGDTTNEYNNILYRSDKFEVVESGQFWLSDTPDVPGSKGIYETKYPRICTWAKFRALDNSKAEFYYFNTHLGLTEGAKLQGATIILDRISKYVTSSNIPVFLGGDMNAEETTTTFQMLQNSSLSDTWADAGHQYGGEDGTVTNNFDGIRTGGHIDWIFQQNVKKINSIEINYYNEGGHYPSDHYPVQLNVDIPLTGDPAPDRTNFGIASSQYTDSPNGEDVAKAFDGNNKTKYYTPHGTAWIQFRFANGNQFAINRYRITSANDNKTSRDPKNWTVQGSNNGTSWTTLDTRTNQDFELRFQTKEFAFNNTTGYEYIRFNITSNGGSALQVSEIQLFDYVNAARNATATADGYVSGEQPSKAIDGAVIGNSKWAAIGPEPHWLALDLGTRHNITQFIIKHAATGGETKKMNTVNYKVQVSDDNATWNDVVVTTGNIANVTTHQVNEFGRYVRLYITDAAAKIGDTSARIYELEVYGLNKGATFYQHANYGGYAVTLPKGNYTLAQLQEMGIKNDDISSLRVFGGSTVELYWDNNFNGSVLTLNTDHTTFSAYGWNDKTSSIKIY